MRYNGTAISFDMVRALEVDRNTYDKIAKFPDVLYVYSAGGVRHKVALGYEYRVAGMPALDSFVIHSSNHPPGQKLSELANYLATNAGVSAHYLIGKLGEVYRIVKPSTGVAWCNGYCVPRYNNARSISIELYLRPHETPTVAQWVALTRLVLEASYAYSIDLGDLEAIAPHRYAALPQGPKQSPYYSWNYQVPGYRKIDPSGINDRTFYGWASEVSTEIWPRYKRFLVS